MTKQTNKQTAKESDLAVMSEIKRHACFKSRVLRCSHASLRCMIRVKNSGTWGSEVEFVKSVMNIVIKVIRLRLADAANHRRVILSVSLEARECCSSFQRTRFLSHRFSLVFLFFHSPISGLPFSRPFLLPAWHVFCCPSPPSFPR